MDYRRLATLRTAEKFQSYIDELKINLPFDANIQSGNDSPMGQSYTLKDGTVIGNRFCVLPMEGWDGTNDGNPSELTLRRWQRFGLSGSKLIWGGEAVAIQEDARANPQQLMINENTLPGLTKLREALLAEHAAHYGNTDDMLIGLQLTHSGRFSRPYAKAKLEPKIAYHHPLLDAKFGIGPNDPIISDDTIKQIIENMIKAAKLAYKAGFAFVDVKHCHGYLGHEFLSAFTRPGLYGGSFENRTRFLRESVAGIRSEVPELKIGVRFSAIDFVPFQPGADSTGEPAFTGEYQNAFGGDGTGTGYDIAEPSAFLSLLEELDIELVNVTVGSPYYNPHIQRPALFPPSDGYQPPEDPLVGVARQIAVTAALKAEHPDLAITGSGYSYLQEWLPNVAQAVVRQDMVDFVGLGRMALPYPDLAADALAGRPLDKRRICRTFSDCTTAPRKGLVSGCYPLDHYYKERPEFDQLAEFKKNL